MDVSLSCVSPQVIGRNFTEIKRIRNSRFAFECVKSGLKLAGFLEKSEETADMMRRESVMPPYTRITIRQIKRQDKTMWCLVGWVSDKEWLTIAYCPNVEMARQIKQAVMEVSVTRRKRDQPDKV
jgi:hypothetical protein